MQADAELAALAAAEALAKEEAARVLKEEAAAAAAALVPDSSEIGLAELEHLGLLGAGTFGAVSLVKHSSSSCIFALKRLSKAHIVDSENEESVTREKQVCCTRRP